MTTLVRATGLSGGYVPGRDALADVTFEVAAGTITAILGPNGGGKTTLFRALLDELPVRRGEVEVHARPAYVPQTDRTRLDFPVTALDVALMGAYSRTPWWRRVSGRDRASAAAALGRLGLEDVADAPFGTLSGGQRQRVLIARALVQESPVLLLDEPLTGVDATSAERIERTFAELCAAGHGLVVATHDIEQARACDRVLCLNTRQVAFGPPAEALSLDGLRATYGDEIVLLEDGRRAIAVDHHDHTH